ncbi:MAG TPA: hypothetical protein VML75_13685 [Kofleriaceae bacterium]|nr:hypothetical protein [Kofleriaceae bacterium]
MSKPNEGSTLKVGEAAEETSDERTVYLRDGRSLEIHDEGADQVVEIRAASGQMELKVRLTEEGPVLSLEGVRLSVRAAEAIDMSCKTFKVSAEESVELASKGELRVNADKDLSVDSAADVRVNGKMIHLN